MRWLYLEDYGETHVASGYCSEEDKIATYRRPWTAVSTDSYIEDEPQGLHPRMYGTYPRFLERYVRELKIMTLEEGIRRMTSLPAQFLGLRDRGLVKTGFRADLVVFDPQSVKSRATFSSPQELPEGIAHVIVNGETVMHNGKSTGTLPGEVLRRERGE